MVSHETKVTTGFVVLAIPAASLVQFLLEGYFGEDAVFAASFATLLLVGVGGPRAYLRYVGESPG